MSEPEDDAAGAERQDRLTTAILADAGVADVTDLVQVDEGEEVGE